MKSAVREHIKQPKFQAAHKEARLPILKWNFSARWQGCRVGRAILTCLVAYEVFEVSYRRQGYTHVRNHSLTGLTSQRNIPMLLRRVLIALVFQQCEGANQFGTCLGRFNYFINKSALGSDVRIG